MRTTKRDYALDCDADTFWQTFTNADYIKAFFLEAMAFRELEIIELSDQGRRLRAVPKLNMPGPVMKVLGDSFGYEEVATRDGSVWRWKMLPNTMADKLTTRGEVRIEADGDRCRRYNDATMEAKIFGIGKLIESSTEKEILAAWEKEAKFMRDWLKR